MKLCELCGGAGHFFGNVRPLKFAYATCISCRGVGTNEPPLSPHVKMHKTKGLVAKQRFSPAQHSALFLMVFAATIFINGSLPMFN